MDRGLARSTLASVALLVLCVALASAALWLPNRALPAVDEGAEATGDVGGPSARPAADAPSGQDDDEPARHPSHEKHLRYLDTGAWTREPDPTDDWG